MYAGRKAIPVSSKVCFEAELKRKHEQHQKRLRNAKSSIDTKPPKEHPHLYRNGKKEQLLEDRYAQIEHENRILLNKMSDIMTRTDGLANTNPSWTYGHSLNRGQRTQELKRITENNLHILERIQTVQPVYHHDKWDKERKETEKLVESITEFKRRPIKTGGSTMSMAAGASDSAERPPEAGDALIPAPASAGAYDAAGMPVAGGYFAGAGQQFALGGMGMSSLAAAGAGSLGGFGGYAGMAPGSAGYSMGLPSTAGSSGSIAASLLARANSAARQ